jgi:hypothetical protein
MLTKYWYSLRWSRREDEDILRMTSKTQYSKTLF